MFDRKHRPKKSNPKVKKGVINLELTNEAIISLAKSILTSAVELGVEQGMKTALATFQSETEKNKKLRKDRRLKNTKLLLRNYKLFKEHSENAIYQAEQAEDEVLDILDLMWDQNNKADAIVESIKKSALKTKLIVTHIEKMLNAYQIISQDDVNKERRYNILYDKYIAEKPLKGKELAERYNIDIRTVYRDLDDAVDDVSKLIFGVDFLDGVSNS